MTNKDKYRRFCEEHDTPLYLKDWWLDAVCGEQWEAVLGEGETPLLFAFPYKKKYGLKVISMPMLTLGLGPVNDRGLTDLEEPLLAQLPPFAMLDLFLLPGVNAGAGSAYRLQTRHTYRLADIRNEEKVFASFASSTRQQIRKAQKQIRVTESDDVDLLYRMVSLTFKRQAKKTPYALPFVKGLTGACTLKKCGKILVASDAEGRSHGACFIAWDQEMAYYVMGGSDPKYRSGAGYSLLMWEAIRLAGRQTKSFDFCGSSIPSIARFFEGFGARRTPYLHLRKINSKALKLALALRR
jgi:hypothetical protein